MSSNCKESHRREKKKKKSMRMSIVLREPKVSVERNMQQMECKSSEWIASVTKERSKIVHKYESENTTRRVQTLKVRPKGRGRVTSKPRDRSRRWWGWQAGPDLVSILTICWTIIAEGDHINIEYFCYGTTYCPFPSLGDVLNCLLSHSAFVVP